MKARNAILLLAAFAIIPLSIAAAQAPAAAPPANDPHAVTITFFAEDESGNPVNTLQASDLSVLDNGKPPLRIVSLGSAKELPLRLGILIDPTPLPAVAGHYKQRRPVMKWPVDEVQQMLNGPDDKAFIATYASIRRGTTFVTRDQIRSIDLNRSLPADDADYPEMRDAARAACKNVFGPEPTLRERRILIVLPWPFGRTLSDYSQAVSAAQHADVKVFLFGFSVPLARIDSLHEKREEMGWDRLASDTGGYLTPWDDVGKGKRFPVLRLRPWFEHVASLIDSMYSLTYVPAEPYQAGQLRKLELNITTNKNWRVYAPKRYPTPSTP